MITYICSRADKVKQDVEEVVIHKIIISSYRDQKTINRTSPREQFGTPKPIESSTRGSAGKPRQASLLPVGQSWGR